MKITPREISRCLLAFADERGTEKTFCPSEVARHLAPDGWRPLMPAVRKEARRLVQDGRLLCTQRGRNVDPINARGPIRLSLPPPA